MVYTGCEDDQQPGICRDPRKFLAAYKEYQIVGKEVYSWYTVYELKGHEGIPFNSVYFKKRKVFLKTILPRIFYMFKRIIYTYTCPKCGKPTITKHFKWGYVYRESCSNKRCSWSKFIKL